MTDQSNLPAVARDTGITLGQQQVDAGDLILPRVKICQQMSQEVADKKASAGDLWNTLTGEKYGTSLNFIPIITFKQRILLVRRERREAIEAKLDSELSEGDGLKCRSYDMEQGIGEPGIACHTCPLSQWDGNAPPLCSETYNVAGLSEDGDVVILSMSKSGAKTGKRMFSMLRLQSGAPWKKVYTISTRQEKNDQGIFFVPDITVMAGEIPAPELMRQAEHWNGVLGGRSQLDISPDEDAEPEREEAGGKDF